MGSRGEGVAEELMVEVSTTVQRGKGRARRREPGALAGHAPGIGSMPVHVPRRRAAGWTMIRWFALLVAPAVRRRLVGAGAAAASLAHRRGATIAGSVAPHRARLAEFWQRSPTI